jgi:WD40 repeat protein
MALYDLNSMIKPIVSFNAHEEDITSIYGIGNNESSQIVTSGIDGLVKLWDPREKVPVMTFSAYGQVNRPCYSVSIAEPFIDGNKCIIAGYESGDIIIHDIRANRPRLNISIGHEITDFSLNTKLTGPKKLCITSLSHDIVIVDLEKSNILGQVVSKDFCLVPKEELPTPYTLLETFTMLMSNIVPTPTNWCVSYLPNSTDEFIIGSGNSTYMLVKNNNINENDMDESDSRSNTTTTTNNNNIGNCQFLSVVKVEGNEPVKKIEWYNNSSNKHNNNVFASCTQSKIRLISINGIIDFLE